MASEETKEEEIEYTFEGVSKLVVKYLSPVEQLSPFKVGQIQKLVADIAESAGNSELGGQIAPYFAIAQVIFLLLFVAYFVIGVISLAVDAEAMDATATKDAAGEDLESPIDCAEESWVWLYVLLVVVIPTSIGFLLGLVQTGLNMIEAIKHFKYDIFLALPTPILYLTLGILGINIWASMSEECDAFYSEEHGLLLAVFHVQVIIMSVASVFGTITLFGMGAALYADLTKKSEYEDADKASGDKVQ